MFQRIVFLFHRLIDATRVDREALAFGRKSAFGLGKSELVDNR
jgi:hypothetical protein